MIIKCSRLSVYHQVGCLWPESVVEDNAVVGGKVSRVICPLKPADERKLRGINE